WRRLYTLFLIIFAIGWPNVLLAEIFLTPSTSRLDQQPMIFFSHSLCQKDMGRVTAINVIELIGKEDKNSQKIKWQKTFSKKLSAPVFVGAPDYHFPEKWPVLSQYPKPMENEQNAKTYPAFREQYSDRLEMIYVLSEDYHLLGLQAKTDQKGLDINLRALFNQDEAKVLDDKFPVGQEILTGADAFWDGRWHTVLIGILQKTPTVIFGVEVTDPNAPSIMWHEVLSLDKFIGDPVIARMANGKWAVLFSITTHTTDIKRDGSLMIRDIQTGRLLTEISVPLTENITLICPSLQTRPHLFSKLTAVDSKSRGMVDYLYMGDVLGKVWKINVQSSVLNRWGMGEDPKPLFENKNSQIVGTPIVSLAPNGDGVFVYVLVQSYEHNAPQEIVAIRDNTDPIGLCNPKSVLENNMPSQGWRYRTDQNLGQPIIRNGNLLLPEISNSVGNEGGSILVFEGANGNLVAKENISVACTTYLDQSQCKFSNEESNLMFKNVNQLITPLTFINNNGKQNEILITDFRNCIGHASVKIDSNLLGRRTWQELYR
ncbi:MAG TPA: PilC/PilY family type IV pilus protein, partial [Gammaproteobacteria bacterium]|nr:PilC/PilY family type IV pilus protein [Gammaproteobacteria bacterium]